ncbi:MAG: hypothetical protein H6Q73_2228 [Firmicutes bacterium]|nr:hypothetical protein [Bacillota bacterium]
MKISGLVDKVYDEQSFLVFLHALMKDRVEEVQKEKVNPSPPYGPGANGWENGTIEGFLESAIAWAEDSKNSLNKIESNPWKRCAQILYMGKHYE